MINYYLPLRPHVASKQTYCARHTLPPPFIPHTANPKATNTAKLSLHSPSAVYKAKTRNNKHIPIEEAATRDAHGLGKAEYPGSSASSVQLPNTHTTYNSFTLQDLTIFGWRCATQRAHLLHRIPHPVPGTARISHRILFHFTYIQPGDSLCWCVCAA